MIGVSRIHCHPSRSLITKTPVLSAAVKVNCNGFCGVTTKSNDTEWTVEEQYFNSTVSVADTGKQMKTFDANRKKILSLFP